ncbi:hypothetical protein vseg_018632 [Gypsophila vaccaria]
MNIGGPRSFGDTGQHVLDYLKCKQAENPNFYYAIQGDPCHSNANIFWADASARISYAYFGDTVVFDSSFRANGYKVPFASFTGINHHGQPVLFGCALLRSESEASYIWLFQTWLHAMSGKYPVSITIEPDRFVQMAAVQVLPNTRIRYCRWSMLGDTRSHLGHVYLSHPTFEAELRKLVDESETIQEFESRWRSLLAQYYLIDDEWLQSVYDARHQWVPLYLRDTFFGELPSSVEGNDGKITYFDGFIDASTTIQLLIKQYETAVASWHEKELNADNTSHTMPLLKTPSPMEKQVANTFTRKIFTKFQDELVETLANPATKLVESETITTFRVAKFGEEHKARVVSFNSLEKRASCTCRMFEFSGIICRHVLAVFRVKNVLTLPSEYILKRWTRDARNGAESNVCASQEPLISQESTSVRYSNLRQVAIKFVEDGAKSIQVYHVAMDALREAAKKVESVKNRGHEVIQGGSLATSDDQRASGQTTEEKAKKIQELTAELENAKRQCELYHANLFAVLKDMEEHKLKLSVKVQNARLSLLD